MNGPLPREVANAERAMRESCPGTDEFAQAASWRQRAVVVKRAPLPLFTRLYRMRRETGGGRVESCRWAAGLVWRNFRRGL